MFDEQKTVDEESEKNNLEMGELVPNEAVVQ
jgi:hypothetical protein